MNLSPSWGYVEFVARERLKHNITPRHVSFYGEYVEVIGAAGELAARRFLKLPERLHTHFDRGVDIVWEGIKIDVKTTVLTNKIQHRHLQWPLWKKVKSDIVLMVAVSTLTKNAIILGWATPSDILSSPVNEKRYIPCRELPVPLLRKPDELLDTKTKEIAF